MRDKRLGKFYLPVKTIEAGGMAEVFSGLGFVPYRVECQYHIMQFEYIGTSHAFEILKEGNEAPEYEIIITETDDPEDDSLIIKAVKK